MKNTAVVVGSHDKYSPSFALCCIYHLTSLLVLYFLYKIHGGVLTNICGLIIFKNKQQLCFGVALTNSYIFEIQLIQLNVSLSTVVLNSRDRHKKT